MSRREGFERRGNEGCNYIELKIKIKFKKERVPAEQAMLPIEMMFHSVMEPDSKQPPLIVSGSVPALLFLTWFHWMMHCHL